MLRLMHVHAHPDDESSKGAASTAKYVAEGVDVHVATCTGGERGSILNPKMDRPDVLANIAEIRRQEMDAAREILGVTQDWLGFVDSGFPEGDPPPPLPEGCFALVPGRGGGQAAGPADAVVPAARRHDVRRERRLPAPRPRAVPQDHGGGVRGGRRPGRATPSSGSRGSRSSSTTTTASTASAPRRSTTRCSRAGSSRRTPSGWRSGSRTRRTTRRVTTRVPCAEYFPVRDQALLAHATQIDPDGPWFAVPARGAPGGVADRGLRAGPVVGARRSSRSRTCSPASARQLRRCPHECRAAGRRRRDHPRRRTGREARAGPGARGRPGPAGLDRPRAHGPHVRRDVPAVDEHAQADPQDRLRGDRGREVHAPVLDRAGQRLA